MAPTNATRTLADALTAASRPDDKPNPLIDRLATALAIPAAVPMEDDEPDDDLDLPMLMQPNRTFDIVPATPQQRIREGRAALIGFGVGMIMLVPIGLLMSSRMSDPGTPRTEAAASSLTQSFVPAMVVTDEIGIKTTRRATQPVATPAAIVIDEPPPKPAEPIFEVRQMPLPAPAAVAAVQPAPAPAPAPDPLTIAAELIAKGDVMAAREAISSSDLDASPLAVMALAETFDPNMLAAWSVRGVHADVERARQLYARAFANGVMKARQRLEALE